MVWALRSPFDFPQDERVDGQRELGWGLGERQACWGMTMGPEVLGGLVVSDEVADAVGAEGELGYVDLEWFQGVGDGVG